MRRITTARLRHVLIASAVCFGIGLLWLPAVLMFVYNRQNQPDAGNTAPILISMQKIGDLHTARMSLKQEIDQNAYEHASGWMRRVPGIDWLVKSATRNRAVVIADGTVEAGLNLSHLTSSDVTSSIINGVRTITVRLPAIEIYPPNVKVHVISQSGSLFYNDQNIVPQAQQHASVLFEAEAKQMNLEQQARTQAVKQLTGLTSKFGVKHVIFIF